MEPHRRPLYDNRMRATQWSVPTVMRWDYSYTNFGENTGRVTYAKNLDDPTLDRSYDYDHVGRMWAAHTGKEARWHTLVSKATRAWMALTRRTAATINSATPRTGLAGEVIRAAASTTGTASPTTGAADLCVHARADAKLRRRPAAREEDGDWHNDLLSALIGFRWAGGGGDQLERRLDAWGTFIWAGRMLAIQYGGVNWVHQDPVTKSQRITNSSGTVTSTVDLDPWGGETWRSSNAAFQPHRYTSYERDSNGGDEAMHRRYQSYWNRFSQPDPYDCSYWMTIRRGASWSFHRDRTRHSNQSIWSVPAIVTHSFAG